MNILLTFDYELFFGSRSGTIDKCLIQPTERLIKLTNKYDVRMTFFLDAGFLWKLVQEASFHKSLEDDMNAVRNQIRAIIESGNDVQFHVHPHWEQSFFSDKTWNVITDGCYKLSDFSTENIDDILERYCAAFHQFTGQHPTAFRAGGWCVQPFLLVADKLKSLGISYDSSVMPGIAFQSAHYSFDFRNAPDKGCYRFDKDVCEEYAKGSFTEIPISVMLYSPWFYWRLYILGRLFPSRHKMVGDGNFVPQPGRKKQSLTSAMLNHVSADGYFASKLQAYHDIASKKRRTHSVVIGHPKSMTEFSFEKLEQFISANRNKHRFITFRDLE